MRSFASSSGDTNCSHVAGTSETFAITSRPSARSWSMAGATCSGLMSAKRGSPEKSSSGLLSCSTQAILQKHGNGHGTDAAGHRRNRSGDILDRLEIDVAGELAVGAAVD